MNRYVISFAWPDVDFENHKSSGVLQEIGICYAFVEFEDMIGVHNAIKVNELP